MALRFGGDMDDMNNPASPFIDRADVDKMASDMLNQMEDNRERQNAAEIAFIEQWVGTKMNEDDLAPLAVMTIFSKEAIKTMFLARDMLDKLRSCAVADEHYFDAWDKLSSMIPTDYT